jgi:hypothetical protein
MKISPAVKFWNFVSSIVFVLLLVGTGFLLGKEGIEIEDMSVFNLVVLMLATYRLTRIIVYDKVFKMFRDFIKSFQGTGLGDSIKTIITCPWCAGVWVALFVIGVWFLVPYGTLFVFIMAISGVATYIQMTVNYIGLAAEEKQMTVIKKREETGFRH